MSGREIVAEAANAGVAAAVRAVVPEPVMLVVLVMPVVACLYTMKKQQQRLWAQAWMMVLTMTVRQQLPLLPSPSP